MRAFDEPYSGTISTYFLSSMISQHVKVALSGDGSDELFASYLPHRLARPIHNYVAFAKLGKGDYEDLSRKDLESLNPYHAREQFQYLKGVASSSQSKWRMKLAVFNEEEKQMLFSTEFKDILGDYRTDNLYSAYLEDGTTSDPLNSVLEIDQKELLSNQVLPFMDRLSMAHSLEVRSPFLDYRVIEFANSLPSEMKIYNGINKFIQKKAVNKLLPDEFLQRPKEGFVQPIYSWMLRSLRPWIEEVLCYKNVSEHGLLNSSYVERILREHMTGVYDHSAKVWNLVCFHIWLKTRS